jgi:hypothetical protein
VPGGKPRAVAIRLPRTFLVLLLLMLVTGGGYLAANLIQPDRFASRAECVASAPDGPVNSCDADIVLTVCTGEVGARTCFSETLEPGQIFVPADAHRSDEIEGEWFACAAPFVPTLGRDPNNSSLTVNACRAAE